MDSVLSGDAYSSKPKRDYGRKGSMYDVIDLMPLFLSFFFLIQTKRKTALSIVLSIVLYISYKESLEQF